MQFTTTQLLKLIAFCAVGLAVPAVLISPSRQSPDQLLTAVACCVVLVPIAWIYLALLILRPGAGRDWFIWALFVTPLTLGLAATVIPQVLLLYFRARGHRDDAFLDPITPIIAAILWYPAVRYFRPTAPAPTAPDPALEPGAVVGRGPAPAELGAGVGAGPAPTGGD